MLVTAVVDGRRQRGAVVCLVLALLAAVAVPAAPAEARSDQERAAEIQMAEHHLDARRDPGSWTSASTPRSDAIPAWTDLRDVARRWSDVQADGGCPGGATICHNTRANGGRGFGEETCCWSRIAENVASYSVTNGSRTPSDDLVQRMSHEIVRMWMNSSGHRTNITASHWDDFGVGAALRTVSVGDGRYRHRLTATGLFRTRSGSPNGSAYLSANGEVTGDAAGRSVATAACPGSTFGFRDVSSGSELGAAAACLADWDVTRGYPDGTFRPGEAVRRDQMASFLVRALDATGASLSGSPASFRDVRGGPHAAAVERLAGAGITSGKGGGYYEPAGFVTRGQMATFLDRAWAELAGRALPDGPDAFGDDRGSTHEAAIDRVAAAGIANGTGGGRFEPSAPVTRGQMARFLTRWLDLAVAEGHARR